MGFEERITYSTQQMAIALDNALDQLKVLRYDGQYRLLLGDLFVDRLTAWEQDIRRRKDDPFTVVVAGDFKRGKSTFINALLGEKVVATDVTTETVTLNRISYGPHGDEAVLSGNRRLRLTDEELRREELERVLAQAGEPVERLELIRPIELLKSITIIDTPGTGRSARPYQLEDPADFRRALALLRRYQPQPPAQRGRNTDSRVCSAGKCSLSIDPRGGKSGPA